MDVSDRGCYPSRPLHANGDSGLSTTKAEPDSVKIQQGNFLYLAYMFNPMLCDFVVSTLAYF